jgi:hypothetical protein
LISLFLSDNNPGERNGYRRKRRAADLSGEHMAFARLIQHRADDGRFDPIEWFIE